MMQEYFEIVVKRTDNLEAFQRPDGLYQIRKGSQNITKWLKKHELEGYWVFFQQYPAMVKQIKIQQLPLEECTNHIQVYWCLRDFAEPKKPHKKYKPKHSDKRSLAKRALLAYGLLFDENEAQTMEFWTHDAKQYKIARSNDKIVLSGDCERQEFPTKEHARKYLFSII